MSNLFGLILAVLVVPYFGWGLYAMHQRFLRHYDWPMHVEAVSLASLVLYFALAMPVLRTYLADTPAALAFALLGLTASGFALYGHMAVSLTAKLVVDSVTSSGDPGAHGPRLGPAEALERQRDYEGAYAEYLVLARMYPHDVQVKLRLAGVLKHLGKSADAAEWFERALQKNASREQSSLAAIRLAEIAERDLADLPRARRALEGYLERYPQSPDRKLMEARLEGLGRERGAELDSGALVALDAAPLQEEKEEGLVVQETPNLTLEIVPVVESMGLERMEEPLSENKPEPKESPELGSFGLERLDGGEEERDR